jgi:hypothetical protein
MASSNYGVPITPATLKDGTLLATFDSVVHPATAGYGATLRTGTAKVGSTLFGGRGSAENSAAARPADLGAGMGRTVGYKGSNGGQNVVG